jgi:hypothetical protein
MLSQIASRCKTRRDIDPGQRERSEFLQTWTFRVMTVVARPLRLYPCIKFVAEWNPMRPVAKLRRKSLHCLRPTSFARFARRRTASTTMLHKENEKQ